VRNEEATIMRCLTALEAALAHTRHEVEVLIGDDLSEDASRSLIEGFIAGRPRYQLRSVAPPTGPAKAKGNVIMQLARHARGELLLVTDADTAVPPTWIDGMVAGFAHPRTGIVTGFTVMEGRGLLAKLQAVDWVLALGLVQLAAWLGWPVCSLGSNMAYRRAAYLSTGGYEALPPSPTEDLVLFRAIVAQGWGFAQLSGPDIVAWGLAVADWPTLLRQRQRWLAGALGLSLPNLALVLANGLFLVGLVAVGWGISWAWAGAWWLGRFALQAGVALAFAHRVGQRGLGAYVLPYELFITFFNPLVFMYYVLQSRLTWKGRVQ
jgi:cellulose synthase/poly-beta-1,6-N-acetylglucosamine synthase-like glycosyltransferase